MCLAVRQSGFCGRLLDAAGAHSRLNFNSALRLLVRKKVFRVRNLSLNPLSLSLSLLTFHLRLLRI